MKAAKNNLNSTIVSSRLFSVVSVAIGTLAYSLGQWLILIMLAKRAGAEDVGLFSLALAVSAPISLFTGLSLRTVYLTDTDDSRSFTHYLYLRLAGSTLTVIASLIYAVISGSFGSIFFAIVACKAIDLVTDIFCAPLQESGQLWRVGLQSAINGIVSPAAVALCIFAFHTSAGTAVLASIIGSVLALLSVLIGKRSSEGVGTASLGSKPPQTTPHHPSEGFSAAIPSLRHILAESWPMGFSAMLVSLLPNVPRYVLQGYVDVHAVGVFSAVAYVTIIGSAIVGATAQMLLPRLVSLHFTRGKRALNRAIIVLAVAMAAAGSVVTAASGLLSSPLLTFFYGGQYDEPKVFTILIAAWGLSSMSWMYDLGLSTRRMFRSQLIVSIVSVLAITVSSFVLIPSQHIEGAAIATLCGAVVQLVGRIIFFHLPARVGGADVATNVTSDDDTEASHKHAVNREHRGHHVHRKQGEEVS